MPTVAATIVEVWTILRLNLLVINLFMKPRGDWKLDGELWDEWVQRSTRASSEQLFLNPDWIGVLLRHPSSVSGSRTRESVTSTSTWY